MDAARFKHLLHRGRDGEEDAFAELVYDLRHSFRPIFRQRIRDHGLQNLLDSVDLFQAAVFRFATLLRAGELRLDSPEEALRFLLKIGENLLIDQLRHLRHEKQRRRDLPPEQELPAPPHKPEKGPFETLVLHEMTKWIHEHLDAEDARIYWAGSTHAWVELAALYETTPDALRHRYTRVLRKVGRHIVAFVEQFPGAEEVLAKQGYPRKKSRPT